MLLSEQIQLKLFNDADCLNTGQRKLVLDALLAGCLTFGIRLTSIDVQTPRPRILFSIPLQRNISHPQIAVPGSTNQSRITLSAVGAVMPYEDFVDPEALLNVCYNQELPCLPVCKPNSSFKENQ